MNVCISAGRIDALHENIHTRLPPLVLVVVTATAKMACVLKKNRLAPFFR